MKIDIAAIASNRAKHTAITHINVVVRETRAKMLSPLPVEQQAKFEYAIKNIRSEYFHPAGARSDEDLALDKRTEMATRIGDAVRQLAVNIGIPEIIELEDLRIMQMEGAMMSEQPEDAAMISGMTRAVANSILAKYHADH